MDLGRDGCSCPPGGTGDANPLASHSVSGVTGLEVLENIPHFGSKFFSTGACSGTAASDLGGGEEVLSIGGVE